MGGPGGDGCHGGFRGGKEFLGVKGFFAPGAGGRIHGGGSATGGGGGGGGGRNKSDVGRGILSEVCGGDGDFR